MSVGSRLFCQRHARRYSDISEAIGLPGTQSAFETKILGPKRCD
jgi:hypothetical protein